MNEEFKQILRSLQYAKKYIYHCFKCTPTVLKKTSESIAVVRHFISTALVKLFRQITHIISTHHIILSKEKELDDTLKFLI